MAIKDKEDFRKMAIKAAREADAKKAEAINLLDVSATSPLADFMLIATVDSAPQMEAVEYGISAALKEEGIYKLHHEGRESATWRVLDYGGCMVHLLTPEMRTFYGLDKVYHMGQPVKWAVPAKKLIKQARPPKAAKAAKTAKPAAAKPAKAKKAPAKKSKGK